VQERGEREGPWESIFKGAGGRGKTASDLCQAMVFIEEIKSKNNRAENMREMRGRQMQTSKKMGAAFPIRKEVGGKNNGMNKGKTGEKRVALGV